MSSGAAIAFGKLFIKIFNDNSDEAIPFVLGLVAIAIDSAIFALIISGIAKLVNNKIEFGAWFYFSFVIIGVIELVIYLISYF